MHSFLTFVITTAIWELGLQFAIISDIQKNKKEEEDGDSTFSIDLFSALSPKLLFSGSDDKSMSSSAQELILEQEAERKF